jgi:hypothetical protein
LNSACAGSSSNDSSNSSNNNSSNNNSSNNNSSSHVGIWRRWVPFADEMEVPEFTTTDPNRMHMEVAR